MVGGSRFGERLARARQAGAAFGDRRSGSRDPRRLESALVANAGGVRDQVLDRFADHHGWADRLATAYGAAFRQTFTWVFMLAWIAVLAAYLGAVRLDVSPVGRFDRRVDRDRRAGHDQPAGAPGTPSAPARAVARLSLLAERIRHLAVLWPLARSTPLVRVPLSPLAGDPRESWVGWMLRGVAREAGMIEGTLDHAHALACRDLLRDAELEPQRAFHRGTMSRAAQVQHLLAQFAERLSSRRWCWLHCTSSSASSPTGLWLSGRRRM